ncbi:MAG: hypothetical protein JSS91_00830 [Bacteroidetes bacterium]|nr:hypothetical protein [Bacteroidota bacterium]
MRSDIHGKYLSSNPTLVNNEVAPVRVNSAGILQVELYSPNQGSFVPSRADNADAVAAAATLNNLAVFARNSVFNGTTWDRMRGDTNGTLVEQRFLYSRKTADGQVKGSAGFLHAISISPLTATPTAGLLTVYDSLTETGTIIYTEWIFATTPGHTVILDSVFSTGCFIGFDATLANVAVTASYR